MNSTEMVKCIQANSVIQEKHSGFIQHRLQTLASVGPQHLIMLKAMWQKVLLELRRDELNY